MKILKFLIKGDNMLYLWVGTECPNKHIAEYDREQSPNRFLLLNGNKLNFSMMEQKGY